MSIISTLMRLRTSHKSFQFCEILSDDDIVMSNQRCKICDFKDLPRRKQRGMGL